MIDQNVLDFFNKHKDVQWKYPQFPDSLSTIEDKANWILNNPMIGWIELDLDIPIELWKKESQAAKNFYVNHRGDKHPGWNSCCIYGIDIDKTESWTNYGFKNEDDVTYDWTELSSNVPSIKTFWQNDFPSDQYRRIRFMQLEPKGYISPHSDAPGKLPGEHNVINVLDHGVPVNIAIVHPENCYMVLENFGIVPFKEGKAFVINVRNYHSVINFSDNERIHMIGHGIYGSKKMKFAELLVRSYEKILFNQTQ